MLFAFATFMLGIRYKSWMLRIFGFFTAALSLYSTFLLMTCVRNAGYIALALCLGTVLVVMGYLYARKHNYGKLFSQQCQPKSSLIHAFRLGKLRRAIYAIISLKKLAKPIVAKFYIEVFPHAGVDWCARQDSNL